jgi:uncharacterized protein YcbX
MRSQGAPGDLVTTPVVAAIHRYPVKSCRGHSLAEAHVERCGLRGDRRWAVINADGAALTARTHPRLVLVRPEVTHDGLRLEAPGTRPIAVCAPREGGDRPIRVHAARVRAVPAGEAASSWFSEFLGEPVRLVHLADPTLRRPDERYSVPADRVSLADGFPLLLAAEESLAALNDLLVADYSGSGDPPPPLPMTRFRPNLVVAGAPAWAEDGWRRVRVGPATFRMVKSCARCMLTTIDPETAVKGREPLRTLVRHRSWGGATWFGVNLIPDEPDHTIRVGDPVRVLDRAESIEPLR